MTVTRRISKIIKDGIEYNIVGGGSEAVDTQLDTTSENPVQNKVIAQAINGKQDALTAGENVTIATNQQTGNLEISATDTTYTNATETSDGLMSAFDKKKLDGLKSGGLLVGAVDILVVGGGGGGGGGKISTIGGGGGGGGVVYKAKQMVLSGECSITIGTGGSQNQNGGDSCFGDIIAYGGGAGGTHDSSGLNGGSGGGGGGYYGCNTKCGYGCGIDGQGNNGSDVYYCSFYPRGGGGGGAGEAGGIGNNVQGGKGGDGVSYSISGTEVYYGAGGGGGFSSYNGGGAGGCGGGGNGGRGHGNGGSGYGAGGGGAGESGCIGGAGRQGIVIIRYPKDGSYGIVNATGGTKYECGDYCIHCFTSSGTFVPFN